ncbi:MAG: DUF2079 domain-containing protein [Candidatus Micrarchaeota archaeon]|nr:DUF2079 domain-containing protein [Candidatus Micrarchaeota archaeon]
MPPAGKNDRIFLIVAIALVAASMAYWFAFSINEYYTFHTYIDLAHFSYDMYYHVTYPSVVHGLQYLSFGQHLAPDQLLVLPVFYLYQSGLTLLLIQAAVLSLTGLLVFFVARKLVGSGPVALLLCIAYLVSPGMHGMLFYDYHAEFIIIPVVLLTFYSIMEGRRLLFLVSLLLLLGSIEAAAFVAFALGMGILLYESIYEAGKTSAERRQRMILAAVAVAASLAAGAAYMYATSLLSAAYAGGAYHGLPPQLELRNFASQEIPGAGSLGGARADHSPVALPYAVYGLAVVFVGFGISAFLIPEVTLMLTLPWLFEGFVAGDGAFFLIWYQYFGFVLGGMIVAVVLSFMAIRNGTSRFGVLVRRDLGWEPTRRRLFQAAVFSIILIELLAPIFIIDNPNLNLAQSFLFQTPAGQEAQIRQLYSVMKLIPQNASVAAPIFATSQLASRREVIPIAYVGQSLWFTPQYLLVDLNSSLGAPPAIMDQVAFDDGVMGLGSYRLLAVNGSAELYKLSVNQSG